MRCVREQHCMMVLQGVVEKEDISFIREIIIEIKLHLMGIA